MSLLARIFGAGHDRERLRPLYDAVVAAARRPEWYRAGVPDTIDGRFDMLAAVLALVLLRLERDPTATRDGVLLTELFIADMDGSVRQIGIGDLMVGKHVGRMMGALGGRLDAFRSAGTGDLAPAVRRNVFHDAPPSDEALASVAARLAAFRDGLAAHEIDAVLTGALP